MMRCWSILGTVIILFSSVTAQGESETEDPTGPTIQTGKIEPPRIQQHSRTVAKQISRCYSLFARRTSQMGRVVVRVNVAPDGSPTIVSLPPGIEAWQEQTARCVVQSLSFDPATRDGEPMAAEVEVPVAFMIEGAEEVTYLSVATSAEEMERALRHCYPVDAISIGTPKFRVAVNSRGRAIDIKLVESSGDSSLDAAGACVLESMTFQPTKQGNQSVSSTATIPVTVRPPKQAAARAPQP
jgi:TonB family protein